MSYLQCFEDNSPTCVKQTWLLFFIVTLSSRAGQESSQIEFCSNSKLAHLINKLSFESSLIKFRSIIGCIRVSL